MTKLLQEFLAVARGDHKAELVLKNARIVNVYSGEIFLNNVAIHQGKIIGWGNYVGEREVDLQERYLIPGLIDGHAHLESSLLLPDEFCRQVLVRGVTTLAVDPHEIANVAGLKGIEFILDYAENLPINLYVQLPSCVPATPAELAGAILEAEDLQVLLNASGVHGLGEMMNFYGVVSGDESVLAKLKMMGNRFIDGHAPLLKEQSLNAYIFAGVMADHECTDPEEALEKLRRGMYIMVREGSAAKDLEKLLPAINEHNLHRFLFCTDDRHPEDLLGEGHLDFAIQKAIKLGLDPISAIRMATLNGAEALGFKDIGAIGPGKRADLVVVNDLANFDIYQVYKDGKLVAQEGQLLIDIDYQLENQLQQTVHVAPLTKEHLRLSEGQKYRVIQVQPDQLLTKELIQSVAMSKDGAEITEPDVAKIVVVERHHGTGQVGVGLIKGFGLHTGAIGSSIAHDSHNLMVVGTDDASIIAVLEGLIEAQGGIALGKEGELQEILPLPVAGLMSDQPIQWVEEKLKQLHQLAVEQGVVLADPFMTLSFMALPVIPELKMTSKGLFDIRLNQYVSLVVE